MSQIHYFQRYSQRENVDTNNTLLLLSRIQAEDPRLLREVLAALFVEEGSEAPVIEVGVRFEEQVKAISGSIPDGRLRQASMLIVVETKRKPSFDAGQIEAHLTSFTNQTTKIMLLLAPERVTIVVPRAAQRGVVVASRTFDDVVGACRSAGVGQNLELSEILDDFEAYCFESKLMSGEADRMLVIPVGKTLDENLRLRVYYAPKWRNFQKHSYLGLYYHGAVVALAKVDNVVRADLVDGHLDFPAKPGRINDDEQERIKTAIIQAPTHGWQIDKDRCFWLVKRFEETDFRKTSSGGMLGKRYFSLKKVLGLNSNEKLPKDDDIALALRSCTWE